ncbi:MULTISPECIES: roadblock/LC7 domain-containing protein [Herpetosiphon]|uniref:Roadblock/LAMTOR2 domain-containing protein n=1 Tax=Herpetosiphon geysericola TaxID=70996 RepID=A0A0P6XYC3_9CHLR|nr:MULTISPECIES: roadblock/LC7 domain-containing protein [Herpetosiphon]KPL81198.1 hypothetical protein SE18_21130 [Herpetosiphon geysericola]MBM7845096.1 putative regulator of Ras-like GTPase activity (Roadblock/LC7/MglB family) [Herpetosiphon giganteus]
MGMKDILASAIENVPGVKLAGVVGTDGLGVEMLLNDVDANFSKDVAEVELGGLAAAAAGAASRLKAGQVRDVAVETDNATYLASQIIPGYFAVLAVNGGGNLGRARFALKQLVVKLQDTL